MTVAIISRAWRTPLGASIEAAMPAIHAGHRATGTAPIAGEPARSRNARFLRRMGLFGCEVAAEALASSGLAGGSRVGLFSGVGGLRVHWEDMITAFVAQRDDGERMWERGFKDVHPYWMLRHLSNNVHALASVDLDLRGEGATFGGGNGGAQAIASASRALHDGAVDAALVVAYDTLLEPETLAELAARGSTIVPGEAAAAIVLVRERAGFPRLRARDTGGPGALARCAAFADGLYDDGSIVAAMGSLGAATAVVQAIALAEIVRTNVPRAMALATSAPQLASAVIVEAA